MAINKTDANLIDICAKGRYDPYLWVLAMFPWGKRRLSEYPGPDDWQRDTLNAMKQEMLKRLTPDTALGAIQVATASGHGVGKTALVSWIILWFMSTRDNPQIIVTANTKSQLTDKTWRELAKWHKMAYNKDWFEWTATRFYQKQHPETWFASLVPWSKEKSEAFAGAHEKDVLLIYDEASGIDDVIWEVSEGAMTTPGAMWVAFGNPTRNTGRFRECWGKFRHRWITQQVDSREAAMANRAQIDQWIADYGEDSDFVRIRVKGEFPRAGSNQFIASDIVERAIARKVDVPYGTPKIMGVDVARFGDDQSVIVLRHGRKVEKIYKFRELDTMQFSARVAALANQYEPDAIFVDGVGIGAGVVDRLIQLGFDVMEVQAGRNASEDKVYYNLRAEMWARMREWLETADIPDDPDLKNDLIGPEYGFDAKMRIQLEKKEDMKARGLASPDVGDAIAQTFSYNVGAAAFRGSLEPPALAAY